jgi:hypothetical protein
MLLIMPAIKKIRQKCRYNMDKVGIIEEIRLNGIFLRSSEKKGVMVKQPRARS